ncbi:MAG: class II SORL domain-containing protein [Peptostreptococcaceae bacterium]|nr:class II SORL domain-containing protein [Peptostreptococcaceae bacterium]
MAIANFIKSGDWKAEKHVPVITIPENIVANEFFEVKLSVGEEIAHPNTLEHHIAWYKLFYVQEGSQVIVELASNIFAAHGELDNYNDFSFATRIKLPKPGKLVALSYCNIHGLWENEVEVKF